MSVLIDQAMANARNLPDAERDTIAALILEGNEDNRRREESFARSPRKLAARVARAKEPVRDGQGKYDKWTG